MAKMGYAPIWGRVQKWVYVYEKNIFLPLTAFNELNGLGIPHGEILVILEPQFVYQYPLPFTSRTPLSLYSSVCFLHFRHTSWEITFQVQSSAKKSFGDTLRRECILSNFTTLCRTYCGLYIKEEVLQVDSILISSYIPFEGTLSMVITFKLFSQARST